MKINVTYSDGTSRLIDVNEAMVSGGKKLPAGDVTVTINYKGKSDSIVLTVNHFFQENGKCKYCDEFRTNEEKIDLLIFNGNKPRYYGGTRYETSLATAEALKAALGVEKFANIVVADGKNFPDALTGSYLAIKKKAPIIMVDTVRDGKSITVDPVLLNYIVNNIESTGNVYILGGINSVSQDFQNVLCKKLGTSRIVRVAGNNRYETNIAVLKAAGVSKDPLVVCDGSNFADALSTSSLGYPILLVDKAMASLSKLQRTFLSNYRPSSVLIVGGQQSVPESIETELNRDFSNVVRISGSNRYETSYSIANGKTARVVLAYGGNFPDGLCGGPLAYALGAPLLLTRNDVSDGIQNTDYKYAKQYVSSRYNCKTLILGGVNSLSDKTVNLIDSQGKIVDKRYK